MFTGEAVFDDLNTFVKDYCSSGSPVMVLVDENTRQHCLPVLTRFVPCLADASIIEIKSGEESKSLSAAQDIWDELTQKNADRHSLLVNLGGGVITDLGGFIASVFKRGIPFIHVPTTLMGMVDAAIGGKTAVNLKKIKNQVGAFALPEAVFIYPGFLGTLDPALVCDGIAEVLKYGLVLDSNLWERLESSRLDDMLRLPFHDPFWENLILQSVMIKNDIVREDFSDKGVRRVLNFGHTFGHAFESLSLMKGKGAIRHGNAVAMGMICESHLSVQAGGLKETDLERITRWILENFEYYPVTEKSFEKILDILQQDKKRSGGKTNFTLLVRPGKAVNGQPCETEWIREAFKYYRGLNPA